MNPVFGAAMTFAMKRMGGQLLRDASRAAAISRRTLSQILALNGQTEWGRRHGLNGPNAHDAFAALPVTTYADYAPYIERIANGESALMTAEPVTYFAVTSGTTGPQKLIPVTARQTKIIVGHMMLPMGIAMRHGVLGPMRGRMLQIMTEQISGTTPGGIPKGAATSGGLQKMGKMMGLIWTSPMAVIRIQNQETARYLHLLFALGEERLWSIIAFFPSTLLFTLRDLHARADELLRDLADGTVSNHLELSAADRTQLTAMLKKNPARARRLAHLFEQGRGTVAEIWPDVRTVLTAGSGTFRFYVDQLQPYLGGVRVFSPVYAASEAVVGVGLSPDRPGYMLSPATAYHEFLPVGENGRPLSLEQVEVGQTYEILLTTYAGLTRYRLGDLVRVVGRQGEAPMLEFVQRNGQVINLVGEKTSERHVAAAFERACREAGAPVLDYVVTPDPDHPSRYLLLVEALDLDRFNAARLLELFETCLCHEAPDYGHCVRIGTLAPMASQVLRPGAFERFRVQRVAAGASASQVKVPKASPDPSFARRHFGHEVLAHVESERMS